MDNYHRNNTINAKTEQSPPGKVSEKAQVRAKPSPEQMRWQLLLIQNQLAALKQAHGDHQQNRLNHQQSYCYPNPDLKRVSMDYCVAKRFQPGSWDELDEHERQE